MGERAWIEAPEVPILVLRYTAHEAPQLVMEWRCHGSTEIQEYLIECSADDREIWQDRWTEFRVVKVWDLASPRHFIATFTRGALSTTRCTARGGLKSGITVHLPLFSAKLTPIGRKTVRNGVPAGYFDQEILLEALAEFREVCVRAFNSP